MQLTVVQDAGGCNDNSGLNGFLQAQAPSSGECYTFSDEGVSFPVKSAKAIAFNGSNCKGSCRSNSASSMYMSDRLIAVFVNKCGDSQGTGAEGLSMHERLTASFVSMC
jgi:hypothetical protein